MTGSVGKSRSDDASSCLGPRIKIVSLWFRYLDISSTYISTYSYEEITKFKFQKLPVIGASRALCAPDKIGLLTQSSTYLTSIPIYCHNKEVQTLESLIERLSHKKPVNFFLKKIEFPQGRIIAFSMKITIWINENFRLTSSSAINQSKSCILRWFVQLTTVVDTEEQFEIK